MGTDSKISLSNGNTYPAIALPWGMNFWMPQTGKMGDGWAYTYASDKIRGFKQTHQPVPGSMTTDSSPLCRWPNSWRLIRTAVLPGFRIRQRKQLLIITVFICQSITWQRRLPPTERCAYFRFTFPEASDAYVVVDAFDRGSYVKVIPEENKIVGYTTRNSGGVPQNFRNYLW